MNDKSRGYLAAIANTLIVGLSFIFVKIALQSGNPLDILAHRFTFAFLGILPIAIIKRSALSYTKSEIIKILPMILLYPTLFFSLQILGLKFIPSSEAGIIQSTSPIFIMLIAMWLLKEKISPLQGIFTFVSVFGVLFIFIMQGNRISSEHYLGLILVALSVISLSFYSTLVRKNKQKISVLKMTFMVVTSGFIFFNILSIGQHLLNPNMGSMLDSLANGDYIFAIFYLGVLSSLATSYFTNYSYSKIEAARLGVFANFIVVVTVLGGVLILKERLFWAQIAGAILIIIGVLGANLSGRKNKTTKKEDI